MTPDNTIVREKLDQAVQILNEKDLDLWLTFVRETSLTHDPCLDLVAGVDMTWHSAFLVSRTGERIAVVGRYDAENIHAIGSYNEVIGYDESLRPALLNAVERLNPRTIGLNYSAVIARLVRSSLLEVLGNGYIATARAKGLSEWGVTLKHALGNALIPVTTIIGVQLGNLLAGTIIVETVFSRRGMGRLAVTAVLDKDYPLIQGVVLVSALGYVLTNLLVDLSYSVLDPRIRHREAAQA